ncbi:MAG: hypothetical protein Fues2KO_14740 [Fuerstiella sp.]
MTATLEQSSKLSISSASNKAATAWVDRQLNPARAKAIEEHAGASFLDVGCGNGRYVLHYANTHQTAGLDIQSYPQWEEAEFRFRTGDAAELPYDDNSFDTICCFETLEHVPDPNRVLQELHRVARRNVILSVPNCELPAALKDSRLTYFHYTDRSHVNFFRKDTLAQAFRIAGFVDCTVTPINPCPMRPLIEDLFRIPRIASKLLARFSAQDQFRMTLLAVATV